MKIRSLILCVILVLGLALGFFSVFAEEVKTDAVIPEEIPTEELNEFVLYALYQSVTVFSDDRDYAVAPFSRFDVTEDGGRVALVFPSEGSTAVMLFDAVGGGLEFIRGFEISLSETVAVRIVGEYTVVWLKESGVIFALDGKCAIVESGKLKTDDGLSDGDTASAVLRAEEFFGDGVGERAIHGGVNISVAEPMESALGTLYVNLLLTDADGSVTVLYDASAIPKTEGIVTVALAVAVFLVAAATVTVELLYIGKKKKTSTSDVSESAEMKIY